MYKNHRSRETKELKITKNYVLNEYRWKWNFSTKPFRRFRFGRKMCATRISPQTFDHIVILYTVAVSPAKVAKLRLVLVS